MFFQRTLLFIFILMSVFFTPLTSFAAETLDDDAVIYDEINDFPDDEFAEGPESVDLPESTTLADDDDA